MRIRLSCGVIVAFVVAALSATGCATHAVPSEPRTQTVSWADDREFGQPAMHLIVTSDAPEDRRIVTTITRAADGLLVHGAESTSVVDPDEMGEPGSPLTTDETTLTLGAHPSGTAFTIRTEFHDALGIVTATKVTAWTKP